jgi:hypothetical protein
MSIEAGVLVGMDCEPIYWHLPVDRSGGALPDSRELWEVIWENRANILGFAHSHPGSGEPGPSDTDLTTFAAVESGLGRRLVWWITSADQFIELCWVGPGKLDYAKGPALYEPTWMGELRGKSYYNHHMVRRWQSSVEVIAEPEGSGNQGEETWKQT